MPAKQLGIWIALLDHGYQIPNIVQIALDYDCDIAVRPASQPANVCLKESYINISAFWETRETKETDLERNTGCIQPLLAVRCLFALNVRHTSKSKTCT
eukprot:scaffold651607_cov46-Prasinocladus_malaysianus.AAC.1